MREFLLGVLAAFFFVFFIACGIYLFNQVFNFVSSLTDIIRLAAGSFIFLLLIVWIFRIGLKD